MKRSMAMVLSLFLLCSSVFGFGIPVMDLTALISEAVTFAEELEKITDFLKKYKEFKRKLDERVSKLKTGFAGLAKGKIQSLFELQEDVVKTLEESSYYAQYLKGSIFERVAGGEKLIDIVKETIDFEKDLKARGLYQDPDIKEYIDKYFEAYEEHITRLEDRIRFIGISKEAGAMRLDVFEERYALFEDVGLGKDSKLGDKVGDEAQAIAILSESMLDVALQDQDIATLMRLRLEEDLSREINTIYLDNLRLLIEQKKRKK